MPTVLDWNPTADPGEFARPVREALEAGLLVVLPGDAGYVVVAKPASPHASRLADVPATADEPPAVLAGGPDDAARLGLAVPVAARRLMLRAWPAPLVVALPAAGAALPADWPGPVRERMAREGFVRFRCPDHMACDAVWPAFDPPVLVRDTYLATPAAVVETAGDTVGVVVSAGEVGVGGRPTVVRAHEGGWEVAAPGAFGADEVRKLAARIVLFVCTGNTCRSPLAEGLAKKLLAGRLGCPEDQLPARGCWVLSAGLAAFGGGPAAPESVEIAREFGVDLLAHRSRPVNPQLLAAADDVIAMTRAHAEALAARYPGVGPAVRLLCGDDADLGDPIGAGLDVYRDCARTILKHLERFIPEWAGP